MITSPLKKAKTILIVDDNMNFVDRLVRLLDEIRGHSNLITASDYEEARKVLTHDNPDIVLLDINLPGKNGIDLLRLIHKENSGCEVIMITNHADNYYRQQCIDLGAKHFLDKSNDFNQVPVLVSQYLNSK